MKLKVFLSSLLIGLWSAPGLVVISSLNLFVDVMAAPPKKSTAAVVQEQAAPQFLSFEPMGNYGGTPDAKIRNLKFSDGMSIKVALYNTSRLARASAELPPIGIIAGYTMDISYLHFLASQLNTEGFPVFLIQPPGNGSGDMRSEFPDGRDGYHNTIEGLAALYMDGIGEALFSHYGRQVVLIGHSRAGYQIRFFLTGLRYAGMDTQNRPLLVYRKQALERAKQNYLALVSLYSPISPDPRLLAMAKKSRETTDRINAFETLMQQERDFLVGMTSDIAAFAAGTSPLNLLWGPLAPFAAIVNAGIARTVSQNFAHAQADAVEDLARRQVLELLSGRRKLTDNDRRLLALARQRYGPHVRVPTFDELQSDIESVRWMVGENADQEALSHMMEFANHEGPTPEAEREMSELGQKSGKAISGWKTQGIGPDGQSHSVIRAVHKAQRDVGVPFYIFDASGDGDSTATEREVRIACANGSCRIEGGHGGVVLSRSALGQLAGQLRNVCATLLTEKKVR